MAYVKACDKCGSTQGVVTFNLGGPDKEVAVELCGQHRKLVEDVMALSSRPVEAPRKRRTRGTAARKSSFTKVASMEDIEAMKQK